MVKLDLDWDAIARRAEQADLDRSPTQEKLASDYGSYPNAVTCVRDFPASIHGIVAGIAEGDDRFLDQGRKLLKQYLRNNAKDVPETARKGRC